MPAAAVIPAPIAYIKVVAVKKLVVGFLMGTAGPGLLGLCSLVCFCLSCEERFWHWFVGMGSHIIYCEKIRVFKAGICLEYISME